jgi:hypothetical protein
MESWYEINGYEGHVGTGRSRDVKLYIYSSNAVDVMERYKQINRIKLKFMPCIRQMSSEEGKRLEEEIEREGKSRNLGLARAKRYYYLSSKSYKIITTSNNYFKTLPV